MMRTKRAVTLDQVVHGKTYLLTVTEPSGIESSGKVKAEVTPQKIHVTPRAVTFVVSDNSPMSPGPIGEIVSIVEEP